MNELGATYDLVTQLTQSTQLRRFEADRRLLASKADGVEKQRRQVTRDIENVQAVLEAARDFQRLMDETIDRLSGEPEPIQPGDAAGDDVRSEAA